MALSNKQTAMQDAIADIKDDLLTSGEYEDVVIDGNTISFEGLLGQTHDKIQKARLKMKLDLIDEFRKEYDMAQYTDDTLCTEAEYIKILKNRKTIAADLKALYTSE